MSQTPRPRLGVRQRSGLLDENEDGAIRIATHDFALPCRRFTVEHKVAEVGKVSVTAEFLIRLLKAMGPTDEEAAAAFFGYSRREMAYVLAEVIAADYVDRSEGRLSLTSTGHGLFQSGSDEPQIYEVQIRSLRVGFDLISLSPEDRRPLADFEVRLPELPLTNPSLASNAAAAVPASFRRHYGELSQRLDRTTTAKRSLYSIDEVKPGDRFLATVRVNVNATGLRPTQGEIDLSDWRSDFELADREAVAAAAAMMIEKLSAASRADDQDAYSLLVELAPEYLKEYTRRDGLAVQRYYRHAYLSRGDVRSDRLTTPILGSLFTPENARRLFDVVGYGTRRTKIPAEILYWLVPQAPLWGSTNILRDILERAVPRIAAANEDLGRKSPITTTCLTTGRPERWIEAAFDRGFTSDQRVLPGGFELLLVPGSFTAAMVHAPIGAQSGLPVPLGFVSFDPKVVSRACDLLARHAGPFGLGRVLTGKLDEAAILPSEPEKDAAANTSSIGDENQAVGNTAEPK